MRVSVCAYPYARIQAHARGGESRCAPGSSLDWGLQRLAGSGVWRLLCGLLQSGPRRTAARPVPWRNGRFGPGPSGQGRERKRAQTVWRGGISPWPRSPNPNPAWPFPVAADPRGDSALAATSAGSSGQSAWGMVRCSGPGLPCPIGSSLAQSHCAPGANGPRFRALAFRLWRMALALPPLPFPPLLSSSFSLGASGCPGA